MAVSGGPDSVCLFDILYRLREELNIEVAIAHFNHRQRGGEAETDEKFVSKLAENRGVKCFIGRNSSRKKLSESEAREKRYQFLEKSLGEWPGERLIIAHTADDQAETLVMRLIRGAGILGLSAIPSQREKISRPLLPFCRSEVLEYLQERNLKFRLDSSNESLEFIRNQIRKNLLPEIKKINPQGSSNIAAAATRLADEQQLLFELVECEFYKVLESESPEDIKLNIKKIRALSPALQTEIIRSALKRLDSLNDVISKHYNAIQELVAKNIGGKKVQPNKHLQISLNRGILEIRTIKSERK